MEQVLNDKKGIYKYSLDKQLTIVDGIQNFHFDHKSFSLHHEGKFKIKL